ncbi:hypothetical protein COY23_04255 [bacterium (Candidatus Torokbacteria) CG_4_10_14_0_2_um_filter_35_8]|nr:MAG: hypothetical protein COY23_04255 [bacterium (Candidatus Torokbacteria) CG_4_10_14_0_2_um_filter_35_8]
MEKYSDKKTVGESDRIAEILAKKEMELAELKKAQARELKEMDRIAKMLVRRDFRLTEVQEERIREVQELTKRTKELEDSRKALVNILEDIEEARKNAEQEKNKTEALITNFTDGLLFFGESRKLSLINPQAEDFFQVRGKDVIDKSIIELGTFSTIKPIVALVGKEIKGVFRKEVQTRENLVLEVSTIPMMRKEEKLGTLIILHDITRERMIERMKTEFVSISAHQLRTPLSAVKWTLKMILEGDLGKISKEQRTFLEKTYLSNERMINLINDLLNISRIEEGRFLYKIQKYDIVKLLERTIASLKEVALRKKLDFKFFKPEKRIPDAEVDIEKISLVFQNMIENAIHYTSPGGKVYVNIEYSPAEKKILFFVKDSGIGISKNQRARVFSKFFRGSNAIKLETEGTGLGLFIAKNIIEAHGGKIWFKSQENKGTTFYFSLPIFKKET